MISEAFGARRCPLDRALQKLNFVWTRRKFEYLLLLNSAEDAGFKGHLGLCPQTPEVAWLFRQCLLPGLLPARHAAKILPRGAPWRFPGAQGSPYPKLKGVRIWPTIFREGTNAPTPKIGNEIEMSEFYGPQAWNDSIRGPLIFRVRAWQMGLGRGPGNQRPMTVGMAPDSHRCPVFLVSPAGRIGPDCPNVLFYITAQIPDFCEDFGCFRRSFGPAGARKSQGTRALSLPPPPSPMATWCLRPCGCLPQTVRYDSLQL